MSDFIFAILLTIAMLFALPVLTAVILIRKFLHFGHHHINLGREYWVSEILRKHPETPRAEAEASYARWASRFKEPIDRPNPTHVFIESVIADIATLPERENGGKYVMEVSIDDLRSILARRLWALKHSIRIIETGPNDIQ